MRNIDLRGRIVGKLEVIRRDPDSSARYSKEYYFCQCDCGNVVSVRADLLRGAIKTTCGCGTMELRVRNATTHGMTNTETYKTWRGLIRRCFNVSCEEYQFYGRRGITVCERWLHSFENFLSDMGVKPKGTSIDRINNDGNYEPWNCRWATQKQQARNTRKNRIVSMGGESRCLFDWCKEYNIASSTVWYRIFELGMDARTALTLPSMRPRSVR
jgi:hypothetical protein